MPGYLIPKAPGRAAYSVDLFFHLDGTVPALRFFKAPPQVLRKYRKYPGIMVIPITPFHNAEGPAGLVAGAGFEPNAISGL